MSPNYVVLIRGNSSDGSSFHGTGFFIDPDGHVATCWHVVKDATDGIKVQSPYESPDKYRVLARNEEADIALLESTVPLGTPTSAAQLLGQRLTNNAIGSHLTAWGYSAASNYKGAQAFNCTITGFSGEYGRIGLQGAINPGDSGGPVVDSEGKVIGIAQLKDSKRDGQAMAIPISLLIDILADENIKPFLDVSDPSLRRRQLPAGNEYFVGREDDILRVLEQVRGHRVVTLTGIGGMGKTEVARAVARAAEGLPWATEGVFYVDLQNATNADLIKSTLISNLKLKSDSPIPEQLAGNRLYVLDDLYQALIGDRKGVEDFVRALHDSAGRSHFLLTSRVAVGIVGIETPCSLGHLLPPHDGELFRKVVESYGYQWREGDQERMDTLLKQLDGYPLAIMISANWLYDLSLEVILKRWEKRHTAALNVPGISERDLTRITSVDFSLALSFNNLPEGDVRSLFVLFADLPSGASSEALEATMGEDFPVSLSHLLRCSLVHRQQDRYLMLVPVREFAARYRTEAADWHHHKLDDYLVTFARRWCDSAIWNTTAGYVAEDALDAEMPNIYAAVDRAEARKDYLFLARLIGSLSPFLTRGQVSSEKLLLIGIEAARLVHDVQSLADCLRKLGDLHQSESDEKSARQNYEEAMALYEEVDDQLGRAASLTGLAYLDMRASNGAALQRFEEAMLVYRANGEKPSEANCLRYIAELQEDDKRKLDRYMDSLALFEEIGDELGEANCLKFIGELRAEQSDRKGALELIGRALTLFTKLDDKPQRVNCLMMLGNLLEDAEEYESAEGRLLEARDGLIGMGGEGSRGFCIASRHNLAESIAEYVNAFFSRGRCLSSLGGLRARAGDYEQAKSFYKDASRLYEEWSHFEQQADCEQMLGLLFYASKDHPEALARYEKAITLFKQLSDSSGEAESLLAVGEVYEDLEDFDQAWGRFDQALAIYTELSDPLGRAKSLRGLASVNLARHQVNEAREKYVMAMELYEGAEPDLGLPLIYWGMGETCMKGGKPADAVQWMEKAVLSYQSVGDVDSARQAQDLANEWRKNDLSPAAKLE